MIRILSIDKTAGLESSHERHQAMADCNKIELFVLGPRYWIENGREVIWQPKEDASYQSCFGSVFFKDYYARVGYYSGLCRALIKTRPHVIQLFEEPWSITAMQTVMAASLFAPTSKIFFYTWENIYRSWIYPSRASTLYRWIDKTLHTLSTGAVCATEGAKEVLLQKGYAKPILVNPYGIPSFFFSDADLRSTQTTTIDETASSKQHETEISAVKPFTFGYIGRMIHMKGIDLLLEALAAIPDARLILIGGGIDTERYRANAHRLGIDDRIEWIPALTEQRVPDAMRRMDVFVLPSRHTAGWKEQLGRVAIEAMATGTPVIGSRSGAIPETIGDAGLLFAENSLAELVERLVFLRDNPDARIQLNEAGKRRAWEYYRWPRFAAQICEFYQTFF
ncbi:MAG: glycosyltransferase family 1 protein [Candidatus Omnitrophota bacterium]|jgi:glycosyltransferase involved in cell wall biosynthesis|nr:MAG: glycosyltransferase family 1 protein [Candidatus Omnitrophota bacterium]